MRAFLLLAFLIPFAASAASLENGSLYGGGTTGSGGASLPVLLGTGAPGALAGLQGQEYIDTSSQTIWIYAVTSWVPVYVGMPVPPGTAGQLAFNSAKNSGIIFIPTGF